MIIFISVTILLIPAEIEVDKADQKENQHPCEVNILKQT